jgi:uncharacterized protein
MWGVRPVCAPSLPYFSAFHELNVRTYVRAGGAPGIWFHSLDASNPLAVIGARVGFGLPYFPASMTLEDEGDRRRFTSRRRLRGERVALDVEWHRGASKGVAEPGTLEHFLVERYALYVERMGRLIERDLSHWMSDLERR